VDSVASRWPTGEEKREGRLVGAAWRRGRGVATRSEEGMGGGGLGDQQGVQLVEAVDGWASAT
jgi:hypothetical protein